MNTAQEILTYAKQHHIHLEGNGEKLVMEAPSNLLTEQFLSEVKKHKAELIQALTPATLDTLKAADELKIRKWLAVLKETDLAFIDELISNCCKDPQLLEHVLELADEPVPVMVSTGSKS